MIIRQQNIIIFSASSSRKKCEKVTSFFKAPRHKCYHWQELFKNAKDPNDRMILTTLIKKIPTFDFAIILSDSTDILEQKIKNKDLCEQKIGPEEIIEQKLEYKEGKVVKRFIRKYVMRDNVLFECGLCIMALGTDRVILLREENVTIPFDLTAGLKKMGVETIEYNTRNLHEKLEDINNYIEKKASEISPIVIGAAITTADGYLSNFILRFWENVSKEFVDIETNKEIELDVSKIRMHIYIPNEIISQNLKDKIMDFYKTKNYKRGKLKATNSFRDVEFRYRITENEFIVFDYPSTLTASYNTVKDILNLSAEDKIYDDGAETRFLLKERDSFIFTLKKLMTEESLTLKLEKFPYYQENKTEITRILNLINQVEIIEEI